MNDVRASLALAFSALSEIATKYDLKAESLPQEQIEALILDITNVEQQLHESALRAAGYATIVVYQIGKETAPGEYAGFTHGPVPQRELMEQVGTETDQLEDGDCLVKTTQKDGVISQVTLAIWMDNKWEETGDEKEISA